MTTDNAQGQDQSQAVDPTAEFAQREADLAEKERQLAERTAAFARREAVSPWIEEQVIAGRLLPGEKAGFVELFAALPEELEIEFAQGDEQVKQPMVGFLKAFVKALPKRVEYAEFAKAEGGGQVAEQKEEMSATDKARQVLMKRYSANSKKK